MNVEELRERLENAAQPPHPLTPPLEDLHRRGRRRRRQRAGLLVTAVATALVIGGVQLLAAKHPEPATPAAEPFPAYLGMYRLSAQQTGAAGQTDFTPQALTGKVDELSITCTARDAEHRQVLVTSPGGVPVLVACSRFPTNPGTLGGFDAGGMAVVRKTPIRFRLVDLDYQVGEPPPAPLDDPTARLAVAVYGLP
ncbi:hypothetical protein [Kribbella kalugense]|uniref:Uncharacterized protein n=1 Tax=Kribbella kalugense TaxID=2512221 RepID=A0A4R7ZUR2_9ACTN|nr:hypothetical protein [Kribbella kalugense]TDW21445.1 hypothetical protein EV650_0270 [Kribbella kalugense]